MSLVQITHLTKTPYARRRCWTYVAPREVAESGKNREGDEDTGFERPPSLTRLGFLKPQEAQRREAYDCPAPEAGPHRSRDWASWA